MDKVHITVDELRSLVDFDPCSGRMTWRPRSNNAWNARYAGKAAFVTKDSCGYMRSSVNSRIVYAHRAVFALTHGRWPNGDVDHIDRNRSNNKPSNLREATRDQNLKNVTSRGSTSQFLGVSWDKVRSMWTVRIRINGKPKSLGRFESEIEAAKAYDVAAISEYGEYANPNFKSDEAAR